MRPPTSTGRGRSHLRRIDAAGILAGLGALTLWLGLTDGLYRYLRPTMRPWIVASGVFVVAVALASGVVAWRDARRDGTGGSLRVGAVGWLLLLPLVVALSTDPGALGAFAVRLQAGAVPPPADDDIDLGAYLAAHSSGGQAPALTFQQFLSAASDEGEADRLADTDVRLTGFVVHDPHGGAGGPGRTTIARLVVGCCAGDATALLVDVRGDVGAPLADDTWVEVTGRLDAEATAEQPDHGYQVPVLHLVSLRHVDAPREPYEYPG